MTCIQLGILPDFDRVMVVVKKKERKPAKAMSASERRELEAVRLRRELTRWYQYDLPYVVMATLIPRHWHQIYLMCRRYGLKPRYRREDESFVRQRVEQVKLQQFRIAA